MYGKLPLSFEQNQGQVDEQVKFLSRGNGYTLFLTATDAVLSLTAPSPTRDDRVADSVARPEPPRVASAVLRMKLIGANPAPEADGLEELAGKINYFMGSDPAGWRTNVATYARVRYADVYPGIDLIYYGNQRELEYDWIVQPGAEPGTIGFAFDGAERTEFASNGDLVLTTAGGDVRLRKPLIYQESGGVRREIAGEFTPRIGGEIGFTVADYDRARPLVIDPVLSYSTYLGGYGRDEGLGIAVDSSGNAYVTGWTESINFPATSPGQPFGGPYYDFFVTKFDPAGSPMYSTYQGGSDVETGRAIAVDSSGNAYVTGSTLSTDFPTLNARQSAHGGWYDAFVAKFDSAGRLVYSTYFGGASLDDGNGIAVSSAGNAYIVGRTSGNIPMVGGDSAGFGLRFSRAFIAKFEPSGSALAYSTYFGGDDADTVGTGIAVDSAGYAYITGGTSSSELPGIGQRRGPTDAFMAAFNPSGNRVYSTYHGGTGTDHGAGIALDAWGNVYVTGRTDSTDFPTADPFQPNRSGGSSDAFVTKFNHMLNGLVFSTYLGGGGWDYGSGIAVDSWGNAYVTGNTSSADFPTANPLQLRLAGQADAFVAVLNRSGSALTFSTYHGGSADDSGRAVAAHPNGTHVYATGRTLSIDFPTANPRYAATAGSLDAFVIKIGDVIDRDAVAITVSPMPVLPGDWASVNWTTIPGSTPDDWIGLYQTSQAADEAHLSRAFLYGQPSGRTSVAVPWDAPFGMTYEMRLFSNGTRAGTSHSFTVQPTTLKVSDSVIAGGSASAIWAYVLTPTANSWIGLYASPAQHDAAFLEWQATNGSASGAMTFAIPADMPAGTTYEMRLFNNGRHVATSNSITIRRTTLTVSSTRVRRGGAVTVTWADIARKSSANWIGLYSSSAAADSAFRASRNTSYSTNGVLTFTIPSTVPTGPAYEMRLFNADGVRLATSNSFRVELATLSVSPTTVFPGYMVIATWASIPNPTPRDWIGLYPSSAAANSPSLAWFYTPGLASASLPWAIPAGTVPGTTYELRLFSNDGYTRLATSNTFTVQAWPGATP
jgi:hypothetical protein